MLYEAVDYAFERHLVLFVHIRKTGGTSLVAQISDALAASGRPSIVRSLAMQALESHDTGPRLWHERFRRTLVYWREEAGHEVRRLGGLTGASVDRAALAYGHVRLGSVRTGRREPLPIALVRDPVDRLVSEYFYTRDRVEANLAARAGRPGSDKKRSAWEMSFPDWAEHFMRRAGELPVNGQCAYFSRLGSFADAREAVDGRMFLVAPTPQITRFGELLARKLRVDLGPPRRENVGRSRPAGFSVDPTLRRRLEATMADDHALFGYVSDAFAALSERAGP